MDNSQTQQYSDLEEKLLQKVRKKKRKMKVTGKSVFGLAKIIKEKNNIKSKSDIDNQEDDKDIDE